MRILKKTHLNGHFYVTNLYVQCSNEGGVILSSKYGVVARTAHSLVGLSGGIVCDARGFKNCLNKIKILNFFII